MLKWKLNIFVNAIKNRMISENRSAEDIINEYPALSVTERAEILSVVGGV